MSHSPRVAGAVSRPRNQSAPLVTDGELRATTDLPAQMIDYLVYTAGQYCIFHSKCMF